MRRDADHLLTCACAPRVVLEEAPDVVRSPPVVVARLGGLHRDERAQILPLVFFVGLAFLTTVMMVVNTGRIVNFRVENQNATDAAVASGATAMARGMNYLASNNLAQARILSTVIILRAIPPAIDTARITLQIWEVVVQVMRASAAALKASPFTAPIGIALDIAATILDIKIRFEKVVLNVLEKIVKNGFKWYDKGIGGSPSSDQGLAWVLLKGLSIFGKGLAYWSPVIAQYTAQVVYRQNLSPAGGFGFAALLPVYPGLPICQAGFKKFQDPLADAPYEFVNQLAKPIKIAGWVLLTLSLWPLYFDLSIQLQMTALFQGGDAGAPGAQQDPRADQMKNISNQIDAKQKEIYKREVRRAVIEEGELPYQQRALVEAQKKSSDKGGYSTGDAQGREGELGGYGGQHGEVPPEGTPSPDQAAVIQKRIDELNTALGSLNEGQVEYWRIRGPGSQTGGELNFYKLEKSKAEQEREAKAAEREQLKEDKAKAKTALEKAAIQQQIDAVADQIKALDDKIESLTQKIQSLTSERDTLNSEIEDLNEDIENLQDAMDNAVKNATESPPPNVDENTQVSKGDTQGSHRLDNKIYPYLLDPGPKWTQRATVFLVAGRSARPPMGASDNWMGIWGETFQNIMPVGFTYASARVFSPTAADLWTSSWRAKLVRVRLEDLPSGVDLVGRVPKNCGSGTQGAGEGAPSGSEVLQRSDDATQNNADPNDPMAGESGSSMLQRVDKILQYFNKH